MAALAAGAERELERWQERWDERNDRDEMRRARAEMIADEMERRLSIAESLGVTPIGMESYRRWIAELRK